MVRAAQVSVPLEMPQLLGTGAVTGVGVGPLSMLQDSPELVGRESDRATLVAVPGPELPTVMVKPMLCPASTVPESAVLLTASTGQSTVIVSPLVDGLGVPLARATDAELGMATMWLCVVAHMEAWVGEVSSTVNELLAAMLARVQVRTPLATEQLGPLGVLGVTVHDSPVGRLGSVSVTFTLVAAP